MLGASDIDTHKLTILVVDDDETNLKLARVLLESDGFTVVTAIDAMSTFEVLKDVDPALILMDIQLPGMDGWELARRLKKNIATGHIPIVALTAYGKHGDAARAREAGFCEFVAKPVSTRELPSIIRKHIRGQPSPCITGASPGLTAWTDSRLSRARRQTPSR